MGLTVRELAARRSRSGLNSTSVAGRCQPCGRFVRYPVVFMDFSAAFREPIFVAVVSSIGTLVATIVATGLLAKRARFRYSVRPERIGMAADDPVFGAVRVQWRGTEVRNLYLVKLELENASAKDFENVVLTIYTGNDTLLLGERTWIVDAPDNVPWSPAFREQLMVPQGATPTAEQWQTYNHRREYLVPVLNRGQTLNLQYVCTRPHDDKAPMVFINAPVKGVRLVHQPRVNFILGVPTELAAVPGVAMAVLISAASAASLQQIWLVAVVSVLAGFTALPIGALVHKAWRRLWSTLFG